jgi:hypothetical protein
MGNDYSSLWSAVGVPGTDLFGQFCQKVGIKMANSSNKQGGQSEGL